MPEPVVTRFAPSPTGRLHLGNARTALFNWLHARRHGGRFLLRIEDTDRVRSDEAHVATLIEDLRWLGLDWDAGPDREDERGPYRQSGRSAAYAEGWARLERDGHAYACFCTEEELALARRAAAAAGRPPRYPGTCATLAATEAARRLAAGEPAALRFRVPADRVVEYQDLVRGPQRFVSTELGDFIVRRADGTASFLYGNALDDAAMGVTDALRGEDHVANTPRQRLLLDALGARTPRYGHLPLLVGPDGAPLSKREGSASLAALRAAGWLPEAVANLLVRLGHAYPTDGWLDADARVAGFELSALGRSPAHFDPAQLRHWQKEAVHRAPSAVLDPWVRNRVPPGREAQFLDAVRSNLVLPADAAEWALVVYGELPCAAGAAREAIVQGGPAFYDAALEAEAALDAAASSADCAALLAAVRSRTGRRGRDLYQPLRAALTHRLDGPELAALLDVMPRTAVRARLAAARELAA